MRCWDARFLRFPTAPNRSFGFLCQLKRGFSWSRFNIKSTFAWMQSLTLVASSRATTNEPFAAADHPRRSLNNSRGRKKMMRWLLYVPCT